MYYHDAILSLVLLHFLWQCYIIFDAAVLSLKLSNLNAIKLLTLEVVRLKVQTKKLVGLALLCL
jgi:hypothetical protein